jgi:hypothetical protein
VAPEAPSKKKEAKVHDSPVPAPHIPAAEAIVRTGSFHPDKIRDKAPFEAPIAGTAARDSSDSGSMVTKGICHRAAVGIQEEVFVSVRAVSAFEAEKNRREVEEEPVGRTCQDTVPWVVRQVQVAFRRGHQVSFVVVAVVAFAGSAAFHPMNEKRGIHVVSMT